MAMTDLEELLNEISGFFIFPSATIVTGILTNKGETKSSTYKIVVVEVEITGIKDSKVGLKDKKNITARIDRDDTEYNNPTLKEDIIKAVELKIGQKNAEEKKAKSGIIYSFSKKGADSFTIEKKGEKMRDKTGKIISPMEEQNQVVKTLKEFLKKYMKNPKVKAIYAAGSVAKMELGRYPGNSKREYSDIDTFMIIDSESDLKTDIKLQRELGLKYGGEFDMYWVLDDNGNLLRILGKYPVYSFVVNKEKFQAYESGKLDSAGFSFQVYKKNLVPLKDL